MRYLCASSEACNSTVKLLFLNDRPTLEFVSQQRSDHDNAECMHGVKRLVPLDEPSHARVVGPNNAKYALVVWHSPPLIHSSRVITAEGETLNPELPTWRLSMLLPWGDNLISRDEGHQILKTLVAAKETQQKDTSVLTGMNLNQCSLAFSLSNT